MIAGVNIFNFQLDALLETSHFPRLPRYSEEYCIEVRVHFVHPVDG